MSPEKTALFSCPECGAKERIGIPENLCLAFHKCGACGKIIAAKKECCVVCEFSDKKCPVSTER